MTTNRTRAFVAALAMVSVARAAETVQVHALDCVLEVPAAYEFTVFESSGVLINSPDYWSVQIKISPRDPPLGPSVPLKLQNRVTNGPLTIETFSYEEERLRRSKPSGITFVRGRKQQIEFIGLSAAEVNNYVARCLETMDSAVLAAAARDAKGCKGQLSLDQVAPALGAEVHVQPVFSGGGLKGWRLYNTQSSALLRAQGIEKGTLMTHICGVPGNEIFVNEGTACCGTDVSREFEVTFQMAGHEKKVVIKR